MVAVQPHPRPTPARPADPENSRDLGSFARAELRDYLERNGLPYVSLPEKESVRSVNMYKYDVNSDLRVLAVVGRYQETAELERGFLIVAYRYKGGCYPWGDNVYICDWVDGDISEPFKMWLVESAKRIIRKKAGEGEKLYFEDFSKWGVEYASEQPSPTYLVVGYATTFDAAGLRTNTPCALLLIFSNDEGQWVEKEADQSGDSDAQGEKPDAGADQ